MPEDLRGGFNVFLPPTTGNFMVTTTKTWFAWFAV